MLLVVNSNNWIVRNSTMFGGESFAGHDVIKLNSYLRRSSVPGFSPLPLSIFIPLILAIPCSSRPSKQQHVSIFPSQLLAEFKR